MERGEEKENSVRIILFSLFWILFLDEIDDDLGLEQDVRIQGGI